MAVTEQQVAELYVATFNRAPDATGLDYWVNDSFDGDPTIEQIAMSFFDQPETQALYPTGSTDTEFVTSIYYNLFNRVPDDEGLAYWIGEKGLGGTMTRSIMIEAMKNGATDDDAEIIANKAEVGLYYASLGLTGTDFSLEDVDHTNVSVVNAMAAVDAEADGSYVEGIDIAVESAAGADVMRLTGDQAVRIDLTANDDQVTGIDLNNDGLIAHDGVENNDPTAQDDGVDFEIVDAYSRNPLNHSDAANNFLGDINFDGTGFAGDGVSTDGNIFLGGLGADSAAGGIGNDFMAGGGVAPDRFVTEYDTVTGAMIVRDTLTGVIRPNIGAFVTEDYLFGGRNADFFFVDLSALDFADGDALDIDGGETADDTAAGINESTQDTDWLLIEASDDDEPVQINLGSVTEGGTIRTEFREDDGGNIDEDDANDAIDIINLENVDASGNLYGFIDDMDARLGENGMVVNGENVGIGSSAQLNITGNASVNRIIGGFDNDRIDGRAGNDLIFGGRLDYNNNPNLTDIVNDGMDELFGGAGDDDIVFEADGGIIEGDNSQDLDGIADLDGNDTLWLTDLSLGTQTVSDMTTDSTLRFDLLAENLDNAAGYGGADFGTTDNALNDTQDQTNYTDGDDRVTVQDMENVIATGLGAVDYLAAGTNDPELNFNNQQNIAGYEGDLTLRGLNNDNILYANTGDDILEGRRGDDNLSGGLGNDDFIFQLAGVGDGLDIIHRQADANADNLWDLELDDDGNPVDADNDGVNDLAYTKDFGDDGEAVTSDSSLTITLNDTANPANELLDIPVSGIVFTLDGTEYTVQSDDIGATATYADFLTGLNTALDADPALEELTAVLNADNTITITDPAGGIFTAVGYTWVDNVAPASGDISWDMAVGGPEIEQAIDRLIFASYEDRADGELRDDDGFVNSTGDGVSLGNDAYAEDLVVRFDSDGNGTTVLAEDQQWDLEFLNVADEDTLTISVNGTAFTLQMGVAADGTAIAETQAGFLQRMVDLINAGSDNDTLAGTLVAALTNGVGVPFAANDTISLTQGNYYTGQVAFMDEPVVTIGNASGGEAASVTIGQPNTDSEVTLFEYDGLGGNLNAENVLFLGGSGMNNGVVTNADNSRSILETAAVDGGALNGSDALILDTMADADTLATDFSLHGDDLLFTGAGDDVVTAGTGDDRIFGSVGTDTVDGGKDLYVIQTLVAGEVVESVETLNAYDADQRLAAADVTAVALLEEDRTAGAADGFVDQLIFSTNDFAGTDEFTITVDDDLDQEFGGAGTVGVDEGDDGTIDHTTTFTEMEAIRTLAGDGTHAGQGHDTLDVTALSNAVAASDVGDPDAAVVYNMTSELGFIQINADLNDDDEINDDPNQNPFDPDTADENDTFLAVDGVERLIGGNANEQLNIDESEVNKDNYFDGAGEVTQVDDDDPLTVDDPDLVGDSIVYDHTDMDNDLVADDDGIIDTVPDGIIQPNDFTDPVAVSMRPSVEIVVESDTETDLVNMTGGTIVGSDVTVDTLVDVETIDISNAAISATLDDTINVSNVNGAYVDYTDGQVRESDGDVLARITGMTEMENVLGGAGNDTVQVADNMTNYRAFDADDATTAISYDSFLSYDIVEDVTGDRQTLSQLAVADRPEANNQALFTFDLAGGDDRVDYSLETGNIAAVVNLDADEASQTVFVMGADLDVGNNPTDRIDLLLNTDEIVASQGISILDFTGAGQDMEITFQYDENNAIASLDRMESVIRIAAGDGDTIPGISNYVEFYDMDDDVDVAAFANATWNNIQGSDFGETIIYQGSEDLVNDSGIDHRFTVDTLSLRGGENVVNYSALETSITAVVTVMESDDDSLVAMPGDPDVNYAAGSINTVVTFQDGDGGALAGGGAHNIFSYTSDNDVAAGTLKLEASQDAEDTMTFVSGANKLYILGTSPGVIDVKIGDLDTMRLTGFEILQDADSDDVYQFDSMITGLTYVDNPAADTDTIAVNNNAIGYNGLLAPNADDLDLNEFNVGIGIDFDILDATAVVAGSVDLVGSSVADGVTGTQAETVIIDDLSLFDTISEFETLALGAGTPIAGTLNVDLDANDVINGANNITIDADLATLDLSALTADTTVTLTDVGATGFAVIGGAGDDTITGGAGDDVITGGAGADTLDGGVATEIREFNILGSLVADGNNATFDFMNQGNLTLTEGTEFVSGAGNDGVGAVLAAQLDGDLAQATADFQVVSGGTEVITDVSYDDGTDLITFTFESGVDVLTPIVLGYLANLDGGTLVISAETTVADGGDGGADDFIYNAVNEGGDTIVNFISGNDEILFGGVLAAAIDDSAGGTGAITGAVSATDGNAAAAEAYNSSEGAAQEMIFIDSANNGVFLAADLSDLSDVASLFEANFNILNETVGDDALLVLESDTEGTFGFYYWEAADSGEDFDANEITLLGIVTGDDVAVADFDIA